MIKLYTDGACLANPGGPGGWCFLIANHEELTITDKTQFFSGGTNSTTNNRMELTAVLEALSWCEKNNRTNMMIYSDSSYCVNSINKWMYSWAKRNWKDVKNVDLLKIIFPLAGKVKARMEWVRGHNGNVFNEFCDGQAEKMACKYLEKQIATYAAVTVGNKISMAVTDRKWHSHFKVVAKFESSCTIILSSGKGKTQILSADEFDKGNHILIS